MVNCIYIFSCLGDCEFHGKGKGWEGEIRPESDSDGRWCYRGERNRHLLFGGSWRCFFGSFSILCSVSSSSSSYFFLFFFFLHHCNNNWFIYLFFLKKDLSFSFSMEREGKRGSFKSQYSLCPI